MKTIEQTRRELFEDWFDRDVWKEGCYGNPDILKRQLWPCWNADLDAVVIDIPPEWPPVCEKDEGANEMRDAVLDFIESSNLGIKVK